MAISTYSELQTAVKNWLHRPNLEDARLVEIISLAEARINRTIDFREQEVEEGLTATIGSRYIALPTGFIRPIELWLTFYNPRELMRFMPVDQIPVTVSSGESEFWTVDGSNLAFDSVADQAYTYDFRYTKKDNLSASNPTNWILTNNPDVYLYASLLEGAIYVRDSERVPLWEQAFQKALAEVRNSENRTKGIATLSTELSTNRRSNIYEG